MGNGYRKNPQTNKLYYLVVSWVFVLLCFITYKYYITKYIYIYIYSFLNKIVEVCPFYWEVNGIQEP